MKNSEHTWPPLEKIEKIFKKMENGENLNSAENKTLRIVKELSEKEKIPGKHFTLIATKCDYILKILPKNKELTDSQFWQLIRGSCMKRVNGALKKDFFLSVLLHPKMSPTFLSDIGALAKINLPNPEDLFAVFAEIRKHKQANLKVLEDVFPKTYVRSMKDADLQLLLVADYRRFGTEIKIPSEQNFAEVAKNEQEVRV